MTTAPVRGYERRSCDYCEQDTRPLPPDQHDRAGWKRDAEGRDVCPVCAFCEDTEPKVAANAQR